MLGKDSNFARYAYQKIEDFNIKPYDYQNLKLGKDLIIEEGKIIQNQSLTLEPHQLDQNIRKKDSPVEPMLFHGLHTQVC